MSDNGVLYTRDLIQKVREAKEPLVLLGAKDLIQSSAVSRPYDFVFHAMEIETPSRVANEKHLVVPVYFSGSMLESLLEDSKLQSPNIDLYVQRNEKSPEKLHLFRMIGKDRLGFFTPRGVTIIDRGCITSGNCLQEAIDTLTPEFESCYGHLVN